MPAVELFVTVLEAYAVTGLLFACAFLTMGIGQVDPVSKDSGIGFKLIILPGLAVLWPVMLKRWLRSKGQAT